MTPASPYVDATVGTPGRSTQANAYDSALLAVMSDHGESLGEHGEKYPRSLPLRFNHPVPLLIKFPQRSSPDKGSPPRVSLVDIAPTLLSATQAPVPRDAGQSLLAPIAPRTQLEGRRRSSVARRERIFHRGFSVWRLAGSLAMALSRQSARNPELASAQREPRRRTRCLWIRTTCGRQTCRPAGLFLKRPAPMHPQTSHAPLDQQSVEKLRALGYVASSEQKCRPAIIDPKSRIQVANDLTMPTEN